MLFCIISRLFRYYFLKVFRILLHLRNFTACRVCYLATTTLQKLISGQYIDLHALVFRSCHFQMAGLASIFHSKFIQEILVSDWIIRSAHAQTGCLQMRSPALSKWQDLALFVFNTCEFSA